MDPGFRQKGGNRKGGETSQLLLHIKLETPRLCSKKATEFLVTLLTVRDEKKKTLVVTVLHVTELATPPLKK